MHFVLDGQCIRYREMVSLNVVLLYVVFSLFDCLCVCLFVCSCVITPAKEYLLSLIRHRKAKVGPFALY